MRGLRLVLACVLPVLLGCSLASPMAAQLRNSQQPFISDSSYWDDPVNWKQQFVPDSPSFWNNSKNWTTNYGPAYRDTDVIALANVGVLGAVRALFSLRSRALPLHAFSRWPFSQLHVPGPH